MRKTLDKLISWTGLLLAVVLLVAGGLLTWASSFVASNVHEQLSAQNITMPPVAALETQAQKDALAQYAGQPLTTGPQAKAYADQFILVHMNESSGGKTYSEVSSEASALAKDPGADQAKVAELNGLKQSLFMGNTLRGLLLYGYAFATMGTIAGIAAVVSYIGGGVLLILGLLGLRHAKVAPADTAARDREPAKV
jgi:predicted lipid-binding transport protein (Tim44 family)